MLKAAEGFTVRLTDVGITLEFDLRGGESVEVVLPHGVCRCLSERIRRAVDKYEEFQGIAPNEFLDKPLLLCSEIKRLKPTIQGLSVINFGKRDNGQH